MPRIQGRIDPDGLIIHVTLMLSEADDSDRQARGLPVPQPFYTLGLIDTGATQTVIHPQVTQVLGLIPHSFTRLTVPGTTAFNAATYDIRLAWGHDPLLQPGFELQVLSIAPASPMVLMVIGRDALKDGALFYDGENRAFSLWF